MRSIDAGGVSKVSPLRGVEEHAVVYGIYAVVSGVSESETRNLVNPIRVVERAARDYRVGIAGKQHAEESASEMRNLQ